ncbi:MAG: CRTAC1 family protein [Acidobacteria bacterium]|nr:MAG: CRTAC1 family protein [Acidobacteriota bacterium]
MALIVLAFTALFGPASAQRRQAVRKVLPAPPAVSLEDIAPKAGISFVLNNSITPRRYSIETMIGGVALFDYNNDDFLDIYLPNGARIPEFDKSDPTFFNRLYKNNGDGTYSDVTLQAGVQGVSYAMGVAAGDYDNDGWMDLYVAGVNHNQLLRNNGDGTFNDVTSRAGVTGVHPQLGKLWTITAGWFDYDNDGWLDLFVANYLKWSIETNPLCQMKGLTAYCHPNKFKGTPNMLYRNNGNGTFTDVSASTGIGKHIGKAMGIAFADYDADGFTDIFVSNDTFQNFLFHNNGKRAFSEESLFQGVAYIETGRTVAGMGAAFQDVNNDGRPDILQTAMFNDTFPLYRNLGGQFQDVTSASGLSALTRRLTAYGGGVCDFDNDGHKDLYTVNGAILDNSMEIDNLPFKMPNSLYRNLGNGRFEDLSRSVGKDYQVPLAHRGAACGDLNNDGRLDLVVTSLNGPTQVFLNRTSNANHWILLRLVGRETNRDGLGARVKLVQADGVEQYWQAFTATGYGSSSDKRVHFGLGRTTRVKKLEIRWPSGRIQVQHDPTADRILTIKEE